MAGLTVSRMDFGRFMRRLREQAPRSAMAAAALHVEVSRQALDRLEDGLPTKLGTLHINGLLEFYGCGAEERSEALKLWQEVQAEDKVAKAQGNSKGFWKAYSDQVAPNVQKLLRLERVAEQVIAHQPVIVPGLLQTPDYRRAIDRINEPELSIVDLERRIELTTKRQARLDDPEFRLEVFLSEAVLRNRPGTDSVMAEQMRWLIEAGERDNVDVHVVPFAAGPHPGLKMYAFTWLRLPRGTSGMTLPPVIYAEGAVGSVFHEHDDEVSQYEQAIAGLRAVALATGGTRDLVNRVAKEYLA